MELAHLGLEDRRVLGRVWHLLVDSQEADAVDERAYDARQEVCLRLGGEGDDGSSWR